MKSTLSVLSVACLLLACGGEPGSSGADAGLDGDASGAACFPDPAAAPMGRYATPADLTGEDCAPETLADIDPTGLWVYEQDNHDLFSGFGMIEFELVCGQSFDVAQGAFSSVRRPDHQYITESEIFWRFEQTFNGGEATFINAYNACRLNEDGSLSGYVGESFETPMGDFFDENGVVLRPFGRVPGEEEASGLELVSEWTGGGTPWPGAFTANVRVRDDIAYLARSQDGLRIIDVSDPASPVDLKHVSGADADFNDIKLVDGPGATLYALMADNSRGIVVIDVTDPAQAEAVRVFSPSGQPNHGVHTLFTEVIDQTTYAYLADGFSSTMYVWDVSDPETPVPLGSYTAPNEDWGFHDLYAEAGRVYINATIGGLIVVDTQPNPASPSVVGQYGIGEGFSHSNWATTAAGRTITVSGGEGYGAHFEIIDVDPLSEEFMTVIGSYQTRPQVSAHNVMSFGERAYAAYYQDGIRILDLSDPTQPTLAAYFNTWDGRTLYSRFEGAVGLDVDLGTNLIYVADSRRGLMILRDVTGD